ncbi:Gfo/Idh/MocA family oxidoreductase [bacterium]|nr:Gfo/Idh/MocA family oxidoreductase [bacterium]
MSKLKIGIIGCGSRIRGVIKNFNMYGDEYEITGIVDPRGEKIKKDNPELLKNAVIYSDTEHMMEKAKLNGVMIGTHCNLHTEMACRVTKYNIPIFLEKPVAISFDQIKMLQKAFRTFSAPVVISFPLRLSPILQTVKGIVDSGKIGSIEHIVAFNDVPYGLGYYSKWYRSYNETGGLFLQKATHDLDYIYYLLGQKPKIICAMNSRRIYGGNKSGDLKCINCDEQISCQESPFNEFYKKFKGSKVENDKNRLCVFSKAVEIEDVGNCIIEYENGVQASYTQNFFARNDAARRGARLYGHKGTIEFDWYQNQIKIYNHIMPTVEVINFTGNMSHFGGDREFIYDFLMAMKENKSSRTTLNDGIISALTCLYARESARNKVFYNNINNWEEV